MNDAPITELSIDEAWEFLAAQSLGRLAVSTLGRPDIFPVNYIVTGETVLFRTAEGTKLMALILDGHVAFEADEVGEEGAVSVVVRGRARQVESEDEKERLDVDRLHPQLPTFKYNVIAIEADEITGRRVRFGDEPVHIPIM
ncbi:pyridoxamine 5'-phosphate oxidase family protein [Aeromicrobium sp. YIM 150415]|uniref:Pyridoxamine 5'-phosphate oxidase family protein n=1 Tax=Aeromicrobium piscarium TaxID=2590901 RepID=A0A554SGU8_9ACTN|nr:MULTISPECIES: pyridoxamine 5'-phosphate oxidase family protein [Aeromicrobium]MBM9462922.1 pyridoxamine 5'-phosphate oxidase family protein [Aeromicrobium sp. YIM 150415]TSD65567.1 pyridoxamine 5'-phosphate oxidase family protein [Aeromicrobium piscarium]